MLFKMVQIEKRGICARRRPGAPGGVTTGAISLVERSQFVDLEVKSRGRRQPCHRLLWICTNNELP